MIKLASIKQINSESVLLQLQNKSQCRDCKSRCSDGFLSFLFHKNDKGYLSVALNQDKLKGHHLYDEEHYFSNQLKKKNELVGLEFDDSQLFKVALLLYGLPIVLIIFFLILGSVLFSLVGLNLDLGGILGFIMGLLLSKSIINTLHQKMRPKVKFFN